MEADYPLVSIVTPSYNSASYIEKTIGSVQNQDYPNVEHIVIDGGSTDGTLEMLRRTETLRWISEKDKGQSDALNKGFRLARGEIIGWLNADDTYNPGAISEAAAYLLEHPTVSMVYSNCNIIDERDQISRHWVAPPYDLERELYAHSLPQQTAFYRRRALEEVGFVNPDYHYIMDWDLFLRLGRRHRIDRTDATWANFRVCSGTKTTEYPERFWEEALEMLDSFFSASDLPDNAVRVKDRAYARAHWMLGIIEYARSATSLVGQEQCAKALADYRLLECDLLFAAAQVTDWALKHVAPQLRSQYLDAITAHLPIGMEERRAVANYLRGHMYASLILMTGSVCEIELPTRTVLLRWFSQCVRNDAAWLRHPGFLSTFVRKLLSPPSKMSDITDSRW